MAACLLFVSHSVHVLSFVPGQISWELLANARMILSMTAFVMVIIAFLLAPSSLSQSADRVNAYCLFAFAISSLFVAFPFFFRVGSLLLAKWVVFTVCATAAGYGLLKGSRTGKWFLLPVAVLYLMGRLHFLNPSTVIIEPGQEVPGDVVGKNVTILTLSKVERWNQYLESGLMALLVLHAFVLREWKTLGDYFGLGGEPAT